MSSLEERLVCERNVLHSVTPSFFSKSDLWHGVSESSPLDSELLWSLLEKKSWFACQQSVCLVPGWQLCVQLCGIHIVSVLQMLRLGMVSTSHVVCFQECLLPT